MLSRDTHGIFEFHLNGNFILVGGVKFRGANEYILINVGNLYDGEI